MRAVILIKTDKDHTNIRWDIWGYLSKNNIKYTCSISGDMRKLIVTIDKGVKEKEFIADMKELLKKSKGKISKEVKKDNFKNDYNSFTITVGKTK